ncbi:hypothetical protein GA0115261_109032, partial [Streptomyces sp. OspMP-M43]
PDRPLVAAAGAGAGERVENQPPSGHPGPGAGAAQVQGQPPGGRREARCVLGARCAQQLVAGPESRGGTPRPECPGAASVTKRSGALPPWARPRAERPSPLAGRGSERAANGRDRRGGESGGRGGNDRSGDGTGRCRSAGPLRPMKPLKSLRPGVPLRPVAPLERWEPLEPMRHSASVQPVGGSGSPGNGRRPARVRVVGRRRDGATRSLSVVHRTHRPSPPAARRSRPRTHRPTDSEARPSPHYAIRGGGTPLPH